MSILPALQVSRQSLNKSFVNTMSGVWVFIDSRDMKALPKMEWSTVR